MEMYDLLVIGGGPGGYLCAERAAQGGMKVCLFEKKSLGGTCLNEGCIPTKTLLNSSKMYRHATESAAFGVTAEGVSYDHAKVVARKDKVVKTLVSGVGATMKANKVTVISAGAVIKGRVDGGYSVEADGQVYEGRRLVIASGSETVVPPVPGLKEGLASGFVMTNREVLDEKTLPKTLVVIGGGVIGLELACAYAAFGTKITVVDAMAHLLPMLDEDLTAVGIAHMKKMGMDFHLECSVQGVETSKVICKNSVGEALSFEAEKILIATGRKANTETLALDAGGIRHDRGRILVNDRMETNIPGVYAIGDCVKGYAQLAHTASAMGEVAAENICGRKAHYDEITNPTSVFILPEAASVGLTEAQAKARGIAYKVGKFPLMANGKSLILNGGEGLVKIIAGEALGEILGVHIIGPRATDLIQEAALAIRLEATVEELIDTIHGHPTVSEAVREAALAAEKRAIHF